MGDYVGTCSVCDDPSDPVEEESAGYCTNCGKPFHWGTCGGWEDQEHTCKNCSKRDGI